MFFMIMVTVKAIVPMPESTCRASSNMTMVAKLPAQLIKSDSLGCMVVSCYRVTVFVIGICFAKLLSVSAFPSSEGVDPTR